MKYIDFTEIVRLLNHSRTTYIDPNPIQIKERSWALYQGQHQIHASSYPFRVVYYYANVSQDELQRSALELVNKETHVVYYPSLERHFRQNTIIAKYFKKAKGIWTAKDYLKSFIKDELQAYEKALADQVPSYYIHPRVETPSGFPINTPNPLLSFLLDPENEKDSGKLGILLAEPGQGKTYMSRYLVSKISKNGQGIVPIMVDSSQWKSITLEDQRSLLKTITHSFRYYGATIGWLDGKEEEFLRATLKADVFRIVFDGFDEYVLRNKGAVQPIEVLEALADLASTTGTRIVITSRTSFWNTNLSEEETNRFSQQANSFKFNILPFDLENAKNYFANRLATDTKTGYAVQVYKALKEKNEGFAGRGFVLSLIADLADQGVESNNNKPVGSKALLWLVESLCEREQLRQHLPFSSQEQVEILRSFSTNVAEGESPNTELLELAIATTLPSWDTGQLQSVIEKFKSHPLLEKDNKLDQWSFKQEQVRIMLLAHQLVMWEAEKVERFLAKAKLAPESWQDLGTMIVDIIKRDSNEQALLKQLERIIKVMSSINMMNLVTTGKLPGLVDGRRLAAILALNAVEQLLDKKASHKDRSSLLLKLCGGTKVSNLSFTGTIARYDLMAITFENCRFERVAWANCRFNEETLFNTCQFIGDIQPAQCVGLANARLDDCKLDYEANTLFNSLRVKEGKRQYSSEDLSADIKCVVNKFIVKGGIGIKSVESRNITKGTIGASRYKDEIIEVLSSLVFEEHHISGASGGYNIRKDAEEAVKFYAGNNVFTGALRDSFEKLQKKLLVS